jgi:hypothetical protein
VSFAFLLSLLRNLELEKMMETIEYRTDSIGDGKQPLLLRSREKPKARGDLDTRLDLAV